MILGKNIESVYSRGRGIQRVFSKGKLVWEKAPIDYSVIPFTVECVGNRCYIQVRGNGVINFKYSVSGGLYEDYRGIWYDADSSEEIEIRGNGSRVSIIASDMTGCYISGECNVYGNILSLIYGSGFSKYVDTPYALSGFFMRGLTYPTGSDIRSARNLILPEVLIDNCYEYMFRYCAQLTEAPALPSTNLANMCYQSMFEGCSNLTTAPELPASTLTYGCYAYMFRGCTQLTVPPVLHSTNLANYCYRGMFQNCTQLTEAPALPSTNLADYCYQDMFNGCSNLTTAPELPASTLSVRCYDSMFNSCTQLTVPPVLHSTNLANYCYRGMFYGCSNLTTAPELPASTLKYHCYESMFNGCSNLTTAPELPASILVGGCYESMFAYCWDLDYVKCYATSTINDATTVYSCVKNWLVNAGQDTDKVGRLECYYNIESELAKNIPDDWNIYNIID